MVAWLYETFCNIYLRKSMEFLALFYDYDKLLVCSAGVLCTLTSLALATAKAELALGRKDSKSIVVVITDGRPLSYRGTGGSESWLLVI